jgi:copper resistance protein D
MILTAALVFTRLAYFASAIVLMGGSLFEYYAGEGPVKCSQRIGRISRPARIVLALVATTSTIAWLIFSYVDITGDAASLLRGETWAAFFFDTSFGWIWLLRGVVLCLMIGLALMKQDTNIAAPIGILAGVLLVSQAWLGHAAASDGLSVGLSVGSYAIHILAAGAWIGGLFPLQRLLIAGPSEDIARNPAPQALRRFSAMGITAASLIVGSGLVNTSLRLDASHSIFEAPWGVVLVIKLCFVAAIVALAAGNRLWLLPRVTENHYALLLLRRSVLAEQGCGLVILFAAAALGQLPPPE